MTFELFFIGFIAAITPGPDILLIIHTTINNSSKSAFKLTSGIVTGNLFMIAVMFFGFSSLGESKYFQFIISFLGGFYLLYIARGIFFNRKKELNAREINISNLYKKGLYVNLSNPKAIIFFSAVLTPFIDKNSLVLNLLSLFIGIVLAFSTAIFITDYFKQSMLNPKASVIINTVSSIIFFVFSIELLRYSYTKLLELI